MGSSANLGSYGSAASSIISSGAALGGAVSSASASNLQGQYQQNQYNWNAQLAQAEAKYATTSGEIAASQRGTQARQQIGNERAAAGAQGVNVNTGSAAEVQSDTAGLAAMDEATIRNNAFRQAFGYETQALSDTSQGTWAAMAGRNTGTSTLLTGGMQAAGFLAKGFGAFGGNTGGGGSMADGYNPTMNAASNPYYNG